MPQRQKTTIYLLKKFYKMDYKNSSVKKIRELIVRDGISCVDIFNEAKKEYEKHKDLNSFIEWFDDAEDSARIADKMFADGNTTAITGVPIAIKDNIVIKNKISTAGSKILNGFVSPYDSTTISNLKKAGAVIVGRVNTDEFGMGSSTENSAYGVTKNPKDKERVAGGSSGGAAAAISSGVVPLAVGSDTGGSIRQPASFCGLVGLKPTYGEVSRFGLISLSSSLDVIGGLSRTVSDAQLLFEILQGEEVKYDSTNQIHKNSLKSKPKRNKIIVPKEVYEIDLPTQTLDLFEKSLEHLRNEGVEIIKKSIKFFKEAPAIYYIIQPAEASSNLARFDGIRYGYKKEGNDLWEEYVNTRTEGFGKEVKRRIAIGTYVLSAGYKDAYYNKAEVVRKNLTKEYLDCFDEADAVVTPTTPSYAFKIGEKLNPIDMYNEDRLTLQANLTGLPALSVPMNKGKSHLPQGVQFLSNYCEEDKLFEYGSLMEKI